jgi:aryl-alcohol dehydrogenase-like predicted oxidoreductase
MCACRVKANTYSKSKYASVIREVGGWDYLQRLLSTLEGIARKHSVDIATVASKWVLDEPQVLYQMCCLSAVYVRHQSCYNPDLYFYQYKVPVTFIAPGSD